MKPKYHPSANTELNAVSFSPLEATYTFEELIENGTLIKVTSWVTREMGFTEDRCRIQVAMTVKLWALLHRIPKELTFFQTVRGRGHDVLWLAGWALQRARREGLDHAKYIMALPTDEGEEDAKLLCASMHVAGRENPYVTVGLAENFPL